MYFDHGCQNYFATFLCKECQILFESLLTKVEDWDTGGNFVYNLDYDTVAVKPYK